MTESINQVVNRKGETHSAVDWDLILAVNLSGSFHLTRLVAKHLVHVPKEDTPDGERGVVIMISSSTAVCRVISVASQY